MPWITIDPMTSEQPLSATALVTEALAPVAKQERINSVDVIRGCALLGILLMNIASFALPTQAYSDPTIAGGATGANLAVWAVNYVLFEGKMRAMFSMLFGAGIIILTTRAEQRGAADRIADIFHRRNLWLLAFGMAHAYLLWEGDILYWYALTGLLLYSFRKLPAKRLIITGLLALAILVPERVGYGYHINDLRQKAALADAAAKAGKKLTDEQIDDQKKWQEMLSDLKPAQKEIDKEIADHRGGYLKLLPRRAAFTFRVETTFFYLWIWDVAGMMLLGMGLMKLGYLSAARSYREYATMAVIGYAVGIAINVYVAKESIASNFEPARVNFLQSTYDLQRVLLAIAHISVVMMICKAGWLTFLTSRLASVGQMALTNYLGTTIICTTIFNGYGLGLFGKLDRVHIYEVVVAVWTFQLIASKIWLRYFQFGPFEWLWRSLTYWKRQPMRIIQSEPVPQTSAATV